MSTITAILEPDADGMLHLPLPAECFRLPIRLKAKLEPVSGRNRDAGDMGNPGAMRAIRACEAGKAQFKGVACRDEA